MGEDAAAAAVGPVLDLSTGGGEERRTQALKLCPPRVFTIAGLEKERRWRGWEEEDRIRNEFEMKLKRGERGGGGGGGWCLDRWVRVGERFSPFNVHKLGG